MAEQVPEHLDEEAMEGVELVDVHIPRYQTKTLKGLHQEMNSVSQAIPTERKHDLPTMK